MKPLIGITPAMSLDTLPHGTFERHLLNRAYVDAVVAAGGVPLILPAREDESQADDLLDVLDALLLSGGGDIDPARYGDETIHPETYGIHPLRDAWELALLTGAYPRDTPILAICRGIQVLNVALGGTLVQDVADQWPGAVVHNQRELGLPTDAVGHEVAVVPGTLGFDVFGTDTVGVNSYHHQAVRDLAPGLVTAATAPDGVIEAVAATDKPFVLGVQWHPELMFERHPELLKPFAALVEAAAARKLVGAPASSRL